MPRTLMTANNSLSLKAYYPAQSELIYDYFIGCSSGLFHTVNNYLNGMEYSFTVRMPTNNLNK